mgnify:CR=1 FL=1
MKRRMNNFFKKDGKSFVLAMDHAAMMPSPDLKDPGHVIREAVAGGADGFLTTYGIIKAFQNDFGNAGIIMRADGGISALRKPMNPLSLLYTPEDAYSKQDFDASSSSAKEAGDTDGPFSLAVWARNDSTGAEVIWIGCPNMDNEQVYQSIPGNLTFLQGCAASLVGQSLLIDTKALEAAPITVPASASMTLGMVFVFVLPAAVLIAGAVEVLLRRRR